MTIKIPIPRINPPFAFKPGRRRGMSGFYATVPRPPLPVGLRGFFTQAACPVLPGPNIFPRFAADRSKPSCKGCTRACSRRGLGQDDDLSGISASDLAALSGPSVGPSFGASSIAIGGPSEPLTVSSLPLESLNEGQYQLQAPTTSSYVNVTQPTGTVQSVYMGSPVLGSSPSSTILPGLAQNLSLVSVPTAAPATSTPSFLSGSTKILGQTFSNSTLAIGAAVAAAVLLLSNQNGKKRK